MVAGVKETPVAQPANNDNASNGAPKKHLGAEGLESRFIMNILYSNSKHGRGNDWQRVRCRWQMAMGCADTVEIDTRHDKAV